jgi:ADP-ribose pyrophosphatase YjhB (NUDIX family)
VHFTDYDVRLAAYALIRDGDRVLLTWYNGRGGSEPCWTLPGGGVEFAETCEEAAIREVREETGFDVELTDLLAVHSWTLDRDPVRQRPYKAMRVVFAAVVIGGTLGMLEVDGSTDRAEWHLVDTVPGLVHADIVDVALGLPPTGI